MHRASGIRVERTMDIVLSFVLAGLGIVLGDTAVWSKSAGAVDF